MAIEAQLREIRLLPYEIHGIMQCLPLVGYNQNLHNAMVVGYLKKDIEPDDQRTMFTSTDPIAIGHQLYAAWRTEVVGPPLVNNLKSIADAEPTATDAFCNRYLPTVRNMIQRSKTLCETGRLPNSVCA